MDDLISRQDVLLRIDNAISQENRGWVLHELKTLRMCVEHMPSAQSEIIRCKECKKAPKCYGDVIMKSKGGGFIYCPVEYCSEAERRTDG